MNKILVTGAAGFIGSHLVKTLYESGYEIDIIDSFENVSPLFKEDYVNIISKDIKDIDKINTSCKYELIIHLAAKSTILWCEGNLENCIQDNIIGTYRVLKFALKKEIPIIFASSRDVYGEPLSLPVNERAPTNPINLYGMSKLYAEKILEYKSSVPTIVLRLSNVYGIGDRIDRAIPRFIIGAKKYNKIIVYGGEQVLDYVSVEDVVNAFIKSIKQISNIKHEVFNIGTGIGITIAKLAEMVTERLGGKIEFLPYRKVDAKKYIADIGKAKEILKWIPSRNISNDLDNLVDYYSNIG